MNLGPCTQILLRKSATRALEYTGLDTNLTKLQIATSIFFLHFFSALNLQCL